MTAFRLCREVHVTAQAFAWVKSDMDLFGLSLPITWSASSRPPRENPLWCLSSCGKSQSGLLMVVAPGRSGWGWN